MERRPAVHGAASRSEPRACRTEPPEVGASSTTRTPLPATRRWSIFGSSNWTSPSANGQDEHNMLHHASPTSSTGSSTSSSASGTTPAASIENAAFVPLPPDTPTTPAPANGATGVGHDASTLKWYGGPGRTSTIVYFAHQLGDSPVRLRRPPISAETSRRSPQTSSSATLAAVTLEPGHHLLLAGRRKTMALHDEDERGMELHDRRHRPAAAADRQPRRIVLYAVEGPVRVGNWQVESDATAAGGARIRNPNLGAAKITTASGSPPRPATSS